MTRNRKSLTPRQYDALEALVRFVQVHHYQPSYQELAAELGISHVQDLLAELKIRGWINETGRPRAIEIPDDVWEEMVRR